MSVTIETKVDKYDELCRLCASDDIIKMDIFGVKGKERNLRNKITTCLPFEVFENDLLPKSLCYKCIFHLETFYDFRKVCIRAVNKLEDFLRQSGKKVVPCTRFESTEDNASSKSDIGSLPDNLKKPEISHSESADLDNDAPNPADFLEACLGEGDESEDKKEENGGEGDECCRCDTCGRIFSSQAALSLHAKFHGEKVNGAGGGGAVRDMFPCYVCDKIFSSKGHLALHSRVHIGETQSHQLNRPASKLYACDLCNKSYSMAKHLWGHVSTVHRGHPLVTCTICLRTFSSMANLDDHRRLKHANDQDHQEEKSIGEVENGDDDSNTKTDDKKSDVETGGSRRKNSKPRKIEREESGEMESEVAGSPLPTCMFCTEEFEDQALLSEHMMVAHWGKTQADFDLMEAEFAENMMESETVFCCEICIREFNDRASLWLHMLYSHKEEASKACGLCLKIFPNNETLIEHVETCNPRGTERRRYSCTVCARQHDSRKKLVAHARIHRLTDEDGNLIDPDSVVILNSSGYQPGILDEGAGFQCEVCYKPFETEARMIKHKASAHRETAGMKATNASSYYFVCDLCGLAHSSRTERWRHVATEHAGDETITCPAPQCGKVFSSEILKKEHCESHHDLQGVYPSTCEICGKLWNTRVEYWKHMMGVHPDCLPYICGVCLKVFCNLSDLVSHVRANHWPLSGGEHCCDICGRPYSKLSKMSRHRKIHASAEVPDDLRSLVDNPKGSDVNESQLLEAYGPPYKCDRCDPDGTTEFDTLDDLGQHRREAHNVVPCDLCSKYYGRTSHLWKHVNKIHKGHPDVTCPLCQKTSASRAHLVIHLNKHHRSDSVERKVEEPEPADTVHSCIKCNKIFRKGSLMKKHLKHCKGPRPPPPVAIPPPVNGIYTCEKCQKTFTVQSTLCKHMRNVHVMHKCELCEEKLDSKTLLYQHILKLHSDDPNVKCDVDGCDKILRCKTDLDKHRRTHKQALVIHICKFCAELLPSKIKMRKHLKSFHSNETKHLCYVCMHAVSNFDELKEHVLKTHEVLLKRPNTCPICARSCSAKSKLIDHIKGHGPMFHPCKLCLKILSTVSELQDHIDNHPGNSEEEEEEDEVEEVELDENSIMDIIGAGKSSVGSVQEDLEESCHTVDSPGQDTSKATSETNSEDTKRKFDSDVETVTKKIKVEFTCIACDETFDSRSKLLSHQEEDHFDLMCKNCGTVSCDEEEYTAHLKGCTSPDEVETASKILESMLTTVSSRNSEDSNSGETSDMETANSIYRSGSEEKIVRSTPKNSRKVYADDYTPSACELCGKVWPAKRHLWQHLIRFHKIEASTTCGVCLRVCFDYKSLHIHLLSDHTDNFNGEGTNLTCRVCGKYHNARAKLHSHISIHSGHEDRALTISHQCLFCDRTFPLFPKLSEHFFNIHKAEAEYYKKNTLKINKMEYAKKLKSEKGVNTLICDKKPKAADKLPFYTCDICSLAFASEIGLTNHKWTHKNAENFKCGQCGLEVASNAALAEHKATKHQSTEFICATCKSTFRSYHQLTQHNKVCWVLQRAEMKQGLSQTLEEEIEECETSGEAPPEQPSSDVSDAKSESADESSDDDDSSSDDSSSSSSDDDSSSSDDDDDKEESTQNVYTKSALSESSTEDEDEPSGVKEMVCEEEVEIVEVDANASVTGSID